MPNIQTGTRVRAILVVVFVGIFSGALAQGFWMAARVPPAYYLSPSGNDAAAGTSPATAWRSLARASAAYLRPGQRLLLQGGSRFTGQLKIGALDGGNARRPVLITSYGHGRATIAPHGESGVVVSDTSGVDISNLVISGHATLRSSTSGIVLFSTLSSGPAFHSITISGVDVSGFGTGIHIFPEHFVGFRDVSIRDSVLHGNLDAGLATNGPPLNPAAPAYANENLRITGVVSYGNRGDPNDTTTDSGSGIVLGSVKNATVAWSTAHDNGGRGGATRQGPVGMFAYDAANVVIEHSLAYHNNSLSSADGGGFDLDEGTSHSVLQYNLSYGNHGAGYLLFGQVTGRHGERAIPQTGNVVRFNISSADGLGQRSQGAGIIIAGLVRDPAVYQNTVVTPTRSEGPAHPALVLWPQIKSALVANNIFLAEQSAPIVWAFGPIAPVQAVLQGNDYHYAAGHWAILWGRQSYSSLAAWRASTGQEQQAGRATGTTVDPGLADPTPGLTARSPFDASNGAGFMPSERSLLAAAGVDLPLLFGVQPGAVTHSGRPVATPTPNVGAQ